MVYWIVDKKEPDRRRHLGPYESAQVAEVALAALQQQKHAGTAQPERRPRFEIVCDFG